MMRRHMVEFMKLVSQHLPFREPIYELGSRAASESQNKLSDLRVYFPGRKYIGIDMQEGPGVERVMDMSKLNLPDGCAGMVISMDTLEHCEYVREAVREMFRITGPGGICLIVSVMNYQIHNHPYDYWRFTPEAFRSMLKDFDSRVAFGVGNRKFPHTVIGIGYKAPKLTSQKFFKNFMVDVAVWAKKQHEVRRNSGVIDESPATSH